MLFDKYITDKTKLYISIITISIWFYYNNVYINNAFFVLSKELQAVLLIGIIYLHHLDTITTPIILIMISILSYITIKKRRKRESIRWNPQLNSYSN